MSTLSTRALAALAFERGEEFDPAVTLPSALLAEDLALLAGARPLLCELSPAERRRRERGRRDRWVSPPSSPTPNTKETTPA
jgi:hypothetical protein